METIIQKIIIDAILVTIGIFQTSLGFKINEKLSSILWDIVILLAIIGIWFI